MFHMNEPKPGHAGGDAQGTQRRQSRAAMI
jgi:hypothetical protein